MMRSRIIISAFFVLFFCVVVSAQVKNQRDAAGKKQGYWEAVDRNGRLVYSGYFKDDKPVGEMKRYYPGGEVRVIMKYADKSDKSRAEFFWQNGEIAAKGNYTGTKRDSVWLYYSYYTKTISYRAEYAKGLRNGKSQNFYPNGKVAEEISWTNDEKNGPCLQYFEDGQLKSTVGYKNDKSEGKYTVYYPDGKKETEGSYRNDLPDGKWVHYNHDGTEASVVEYVDGKIANLNQVEAAEQEFFKKIEAQKDRIKEPTVEDMMREAKTIENR